MTIGRHDSPGKVEPAPSEQRTASRYLAIAALLGAAGCAAPGVGPGAAPPGGPAGPDATRAVEPESRPLRIWTAHEGIAPGTLVLDGPPVSSGTRVSIIDDRGMVGEAEIAAEPPPECDDCSADRLLARSVSVILPLEGEAVAVHPLARDGAGLTWYTYPDAGDPGPEPRRWIELDADGDGAAEATLSVWCAEPVPSGCNDAVCARVCRGLFDDAGAPIDAAICRSFIPDVDDCVLFDGGCARDDDACRNIVLDPIASERIVVFESEGVRMEFAFDDVRRVGAERGVAGLVTFLDARERAVVRLDHGEPSLPGQQVPMVLAALLEEGRARVFDPASGEPVEHLVQEEWFWMGCGGRCRQSGRQWRLRIPGEVFFRVTDLFGD
jgi:hypothetical protein